jgi:hypothetical protein
MAIEISNINIHIFKNNHAVSPVKSLLFEWVLRLQVNRMMSCFDLVRERNEGWAGLGRRGEGRDI